MIVHHEVLYSKPVVNLKVSDHEPLHLIELLTLLQWAARHGYAVKTARDMTSKYDAIYSEVYAVWYAIDNGIDIFAGNVARLFALVEWRCSEQ